MKQKLSLVFKLLQIAVLMGVLYSYAMFQGGFVSWFLYYSFLPLLIYLFLLLCYPISNWTVKRDISKGAAKAGGSIEVEVEIKRKFVFPIYYCIVEEFFPASLQQNNISSQDYHHLDNPEKLNEHRVYKKALFPWFKRSVHFRYTLKNLPRGEHHLHAIRIKTGDFFGFVRKDYVYPVSNHLLVYPSYRNLIVKEKVTSFDEGAKPSHVLNMRSTNVVTGVREYTPGDRFSWIDWKATARKNTVMTKEFEQEKSSNILLILDSVYYEGLNKLLFEATVEISYSLIEIYTMQSPQVSFLSLGKDKHFVPSKGELVKRSLARIEPGGDVAFHQLLTEEVKKVPHGIITMIVTSNLTPKLKHSVEQVRQKSKRVVLVVIKPSAKLTAIDKQLLQQLSAKGIVNNLLTEEQLTLKEFEVNM